MSAKKPKTKKKDMGIKFEAETLSLASMHLRAAPASREDGVQEELVCSREAMFSAEMIRLLIDRIRSL